MDHLRVRSLYHLHKIYTFVILYSFLFPCKKSTNETSYDCNTRRHVGHFHLCFSSILYTIWNYIVVTIEKESETDHQDQFKKNIPDNKTENS